MMVGYLPNWLSPFLGADYFTHCGNHSLMGKNEKNYFCIDCVQGPICHTELLTEHTHHRTLQVRRASHMNAVRISDIHGLIDVSDIQSYVINGAKIVFLLSRPQQKVVKGARHWCSVCGRTIADPVKYCSIGCKLASCIPVHTDDGFSPNRYTIPVHTEDGFESGANSIPVHTGAGQEEEFWEKSDSSCVHTGPRAEQTGLNPFHTGTKSHQGWYPVHIGAKSWEEDKSWTKKGLIPVHTGARSHRRDAFAAKASAIRIHTAAKSNRDHFVPFHVHTGVQSKEESDPVHTGTNSLELPFHIGAKSSQAPVHTEENSQRELGSVHTGEYSQEGLARVHTEAKSYQEGVSDSESFEPSTPPLRADFCIQAAAKRPRLASGERLKKTPYERLFFTLTQPASHPPPVVSRQRPGGAGSSWATAAAARGASGSLRVRRRKGSPRRAPLS